jgi:predicted component of type VI protein secretion system
MPNKKKPTTLEEVGETLAYIVQNMPMKDEVATKDDIAELATGADLANVARSVTRIERELGDVRRELEELSRKVDNVTGFRKEIDHALERIAAIEKHLGLDKKIAA